MSAVLASHLHVPLAYHLSGTFYIYGPRERAALPSDSARIESPQKICRRLSRSERAGLVRGSGRARVILGPRIVRARSIGRPPAQLNHSKQVSW
jgi:hypothetical protein